MYVNEVPHCNVVKVIQKNHLPITHIAVTIFHVRTHYFCVHMLY